MTQSPKSNTMPSKDRKLGAGMNLRAGNKKRLTPQAMKNAMKVFSLLDISSGSRGIAIWGRRSADPVVPKPAAWMTVEIEIPSLFVAY